MGQMIPINLPADGNWPTIVGDSIMIIGPRQNELTEEQRYFNPVYLMVYPGKEHLQAEIIRAGLCDCDLTKPNRRIGVFSVAPNKQVSFSQGNLQYLPAIRLWKFANTQYEYLGNANKYLKPMFRNWVDLFGWSANNTTAPFGVSTSMSASDYAGDFVDWGTNTICGDMPGIWRTLSMDEWDYLFKKRTNAAQLYSQGSIEGTRGMIVLPDNWVLPEGVQFTVDTANLTMDLDLNAYSYAEWQKMEDAGAVFLCVTGRRDGKEVGYLQEYGGYWSSTTTSITTYHWFFNYIREVLTLYDNSNRVQGRSVRLVHDTIVPEPPKRIGVFSVGADKQVSFSQGNLQYIQSTDTWQFAREQYEYMGEKHFRNGQLADTIEYFGWSGKNSKAPWGISLSIESSDYEGEFLDWGTNTIAGSAPNTWRTLSNDEWNYICQGRKNAANLLGFGKIDTISGLIILPDDWVAPDGITFTPNIDNPNSNPYNLQQWNAMENAGAVFIPPTGYFNHKMDNMRTVHQYGYYRTSTLAQDGRQIFSLFSIIEDGLPNGLSGWIVYSYSGNNQSNLFYAYPVRLVHDTIVPKPEPEYVDLGLSVKWATFNVGATSPEDYGDYFAWGETEPKETYSWATYKWGTSSNLTKYNATDGKTILEPEDDAAHVHWGGKWRMPTKEEMQELFDNCTWKEETRNGINGHIVTGPNGNSIFIPTTGYHNDDNGTGVQGLGTITYLWTSSTPGNANAYDLLLSHPTLADGIGSNTRRVGMPIRPVYDDRPPKRIGVFSVAADKQVSFSQGNLQYIQSTDTWQFAANQLEYMGHKHYRNGQLADTIEYFGWSGKDSKAPWGISLSTESSDYAGEFLDWGTNTIAGSAPNTWRTLSNDEWLYICQGRKNADQLLGLGKISSIFGLIILPDDWVAPEGITFTPNDNNPNANVYSLQQWTAMEEAGAIFIPPTGYFNHDIDNMRYVGTYGYARNNTLTANGLQIYTLFKPSEIQYSRSAQGNNGNLYYAFPQRLVHDTIVLEAEPEYVDLGLSVKWATFNVGASKPEDYGDYFAWGETEPKEVYSWATYKWGTSSNMTKYNTTDGKTILDIDDDAAYVNWGGDWRMPSKEEVDELTQQCNWLWTTHNNVNGYKVTGPNGNSIFLPAAGYKGSGPTYPEGEDGLYWTNTLEKQHYSYLIVLHDDAPPTQAGTQGTRCFGFTIRPVYDEVPDPCLVVKVNDTLSINLMCVEGGTFMMGSDAPDAQADEQPVHEVTLSDYYIEQTEVTQHLWKAVMGSDNNPSAVKGNNLPVTNITWDEAQQFVERLSELTGMRFRLPTEAEWEYAARGGQYSKGYTYAGSNDIDQVGWYNGNSSNKTHAVGQKQPNELGIYDMTGNVWEYCSDWHMPYAAQAQTNPTGAATGDKHVLRGGCYHYDSKNCTNTNRHSYYTPDKGGASTGLRIVLEP